MLVGNNVVNGTNHMKSVIIQLFNKVEPPRLRSMVHNAAETGHLKGGNSAKLQHWVGKALWFSEAAVHLLADAAETYDRILHLRNNQNISGRSMRPLRETRFHGQHMGQVHATTTVFRPAASTLSDDDLFDMDYDSDEEAFPT